MTRILFTTAIAIISLHTDLSMASCRQADISSHKGWSIALIKTGATKSESKTFYFSAFRNGKYLELSNIITLSTQEHINLDKHLGKTTINKNCSVHFEFLESQSESSQRLSKPNILVGDGFLSNKSGKILGAYKISNDEIVLEMGTLIAMRN